MGFLNKPFQVPPQTAAHPHWCWASIAAGVWSYYEGVPWTMDQVVVLALEPDCSGQLDPADADSEWHLEDALSLNNPCCPANNAAHDHLAQPPLSTVQWDDLRHQIDDLQSPVCVAVTFLESGTSHYCAINGVFQQNGEPWISLLDPAALPPGEQRMSFADFSSNNVLLQSDSSYPALWSSTFYTK